MTLRSLAAFTLDNFTFLLIFFQCPCKKIRESLSKKNKIAAGSCKIKIKITQIHTSSLPIASIKYLGKYYILLIGIQVR